MGGAVVGAVVGEAVVMSGGVVVGGAVVGVVGGAVVGVVGGAVAGVVGGAVVGGAVVGVAMRGKRWVMIHCTCICYYQLTYLCHYIYNLHLLHSITIRYSTLICSNWWHDVGQSVQTNLFGGASSEKTHRAGTSRDYSAIRVVPLPYITTITVPTTLSVDVSSHTHQSTPSLVRISKYTYVSGVYCISRQVQSAPQCEVQSF